MMIKITFAASLGRLLLASLILMLVFCGIGFADQLKFGDWVGVAETDPLTAKEQKKNRNLCPGWNQYYMVVGCGFRPGEDPADPGIKETYCIGLFFIPY